jgi:hypothetical protein
MRIFFLLCMCLTTRVQAGEKSQGPSSSEFPPPPSHPLLFPYDDVIVQYDVTVPRRGVQEKNGLPLEPTLDHALQYAVIWMLLCEIFASYHFTRSPDCKTVNSDV